MKAKALGRLLTAGLLSSAVVFVSITGKAQIPTPTANWVNIKDPKFGAIGNGSHDDTAAIQAAIDYAFANNLSAVYCPAGYYKISNTIYLDPPGIFDQIYPTRRCSVSRWHSSVIRATLAVREMEISVD